MAEKLIKRGNVWYYRFTDADGKRRMRKGCTDKRETERKANAARLEADKAKSDPREAGYRRHEAQSVSEHLDDFERSLLAKGGTKKHAQVTRYRANRVLDGAKVNRISDLSLSKIMDALQDIRTTEGFNQETINHYIRAVKAFSRWLWKDKRAREHHLAHLATSNSEGDRRYIRRPLTPEEAARVIQTAEAGPVVMGMTGPDRAMLYMIALSTGFRAMRELRPLTPERFNLDSDPPTITVKAAYAKNGREAIQPIPAALADRIRPWLATKAPGKPVFTGMTKRTAEMLRHDLEAAKVPYETSEGVIDFHASRVSYITNLVASGASVKTCQTLARHSTPVLTIGVYAKASLHDVKGAVESLPDPTATKSGSERAVLASTGTDGEHSSKRLLHPVSNSGPYNGPGMASTDAIACFDNENSADRKSLENKDLGVQCCALTPSGAMSEEMPEMRGSRILSPQRLPFRHAGSRWLVHTRHGTAAHQHNEPYVPEAI
jgi:site-specific recombinase XerD